GSPPIGTGSSFDVTNNPIETELTELGALRDRIPALATGWTIVRYAKGGQLVVSRIDAASHREYVVGFNNTSSLATEQVATSTPSTTWLPQNCPAKGNPDRSDASGQLSVTVPALGACVYAAQTTIPAAAPPKPKLVVKADDLSNLWAATATVKGAAPVSVAFAVRRAGAKAWQRLDVDTSPPFRGF